MRRVCEYTRLFLIDNLIDGYVNITKCIYL